MIHRKKQGIQFFFEKRVLCREAPEWPQNVMSNSILNTFEKKMEGVSGQYITQIINELYDKSNILGESSGDGFNKGNFKKKENAKFIQRVLVTLKYDISYGGKNNYDSIDGGYGRKTRNAVAALQGDLGIQTADGIFGNGTAKKLIDVLHKIEKKREESTRSRLEKMKEHVGTTRELSDITPEEKEFLGKMRFLDLSSGKGLIEHADDVSHGLKILGYDVTPEMLRKIPFQPVLGRPAIIQAAQRRFKAGTDRWPGKTFWNNVWKEAKDIKPKDIREKLTEEAEVTEDEVVTEEAEVTEDEVVRTPGDLSDITPEQKEFLKKMTPFSYRKGQELIDRAKDISKAFQILGYKGVTPQMIRKIPTTQDSRDRPEIIEKAQKRFNAGDRNGRYDRWPGGKLWRNIWNEAKNIEPKTIKGTLNDAKAAIEKAKVYLQQLKRTKKIRELSDHLGEEIATEIVDNNIQALDEGELEGIKGTGRVYKRHRNKIYYMDPNLNKNFLFRCIGKEAEGKTFLFTQGENVPKEMVEVKQQTENYFSEINGGSRSFNKWGGVREQVSHGIALHNVDDIG